MTPSDESFAIILAQSEAAERGALSIWTIYDRPKDHPHGTIARRFEITAGVTKATGTTLTGSLEIIRETLAAAGLVCLPRDKGDAPHIVESWI